MCANNWEGGKDLFFWGEGQQLRATGLRAAKNNPSEYVNIQSSQCRYFHN